MSLKGVQKINAKLREGLGLIKAQGIRRFIKEAFEYLFWESLGYRTFLPLAIREFKKKKQRIDSVDDMVDFAFDFNYFGLSIRPGQFKNEITQLLNSIKVLAPEHLMEIGTAKGGTLFLFCQVASANAQVISVDLPAGKFGGGYTASKSKLYRAFAKGNQEIVLMRKNAHDSETLNEVKGILSGSKLDFLFIDGDHTYEGVKQDFQMYHTLVRRGGIIGFHDIVEGPPELVGGVHRFWTEIKDSYRFNEFINELNQVTYGVGIIYI
jgi:predicted O-methyltransferase YrrM